eukprot:5413094-Amphidinium_carterae.1
MSPGPHRGKAASEGLSLPLSLLGQLCLSLGYDSAHGGPHESQCCTTLHRLSVQNRGAAQPVYRIEAPRQT